MCHLCHLPVPDQGYSLNDPMAPSEDHLTPVALGGTDRWSNLRLAHRRCNERRNDLPMWDIPEGFFDDVWK